MAIRLRSVDGVRVALCAAETDPMLDDVYLDDGDHYALAAKFANDWQGQTLPSVLREVDAQEKLIDLARAALIEIAECAPAIEDHTGRWSEALLKAVAISKSALTSIGSAPKPAKVG